MLILSQGAWQAGSFSLTCKHNRNFNTHFTHLADQILDYTLTNCGFKPCKEAYLLL